MASGEQMLQSSLKTLHRILRAFVVLAVITGITLGIFFTLLAFSPLKNNYRVVINHGSQGSDIISKFREFHLISGKLGELFFKASLKYFEYNDQFIQSGEYHFSKTDNLAKVLNKLLNGSTVTHSITIPEGAKAIDVVNIVNSSPSMVGEITLKDIPEGSVMPETYFYKHGMNRREMLRNMQRAMKKFLDNNNVKNYHKTLTMASLVQAESYNIEEMPIIAGVIKNRLTINMRLQLCSTIHYAFKLANPKYEPKHLYYKDLQLESPFNTYKIRGLPPTPINSPGKEAILASITPRKTDYLYFFTNDNKNHIFSKTYQSHLKEQ